MESTDGCSMGLLGGKTEIPSNKDSRARKRRSIVKVFIAGATGVLGRRLIRQLRERGHAVTGLARNA